MSVSGFIQDMKNKLRERQTQQTQRTAGELASMRKERMRLEGQRKVYDIHAKERDRLEKAKKDLQRRRFDNSVLGRTHKALKKIKKDIDTSKKDRPKSLFTQENSKPAFGGGIFGSEPKKDKPKSRGGFEL